jgi:transposase-like protein
MAKNMVQFQKGLSLRAFLSSYGTEEQCRRELFKLRWPGGFQCPTCGYGNGCEIRRRRVHQCHRCHHQTSLTAGTVFHSSKLPLTVWFLAAFLLTQNKNGVSAMELGRQLGVSYNAAWRIKHKLMQAMLERDSARKLEGRIEMDDAYLGGERTGKRGRGAEGKTPFLAAVQTREGNPVRIKLTRLAGFRSQEIERWSRHHLKPGSVVMSDGLSCFAAVTEAGCEHIPKRTGGGKRSVEDPAFRWVNTVLGNLKNALRGTYHSIGAKHASRYLAEFQYRFNRRYDLQSLVPRLLYAAAHTSPRPQRFLVLAEDGW